LLGYRNQFVVDTKGEGIMSSRFVAFKPYAGEIRKRVQGSMISMATGKALGFSLWGLQDRGLLYITPAVEVYEGQVIGNTAKGDEMNVNPTKGKAMSNVRSSGTDEAMTLFPAFELTIERGLEVKKIIYIESLVDLMGSYLHSFEWLKSKKKFSIPPSTRRLL
jgi:GTP-binding protein